MKTYIYCLVRNGSCSGTISPKFMAIFQAVNDYLFISKTHKMFI